MNSAEALLHEASDFPVETQRALLHYALSETRKELCDLMGSQTATNNALADYLQEMEAAIDEGFEQVAELAFRQLGDIAYLMQHREILIILKADNFREYRDRLREMNWAGM